MRLQKEQHGATLWSIAFILFLIGFAAFTTLKLFPVYMEDFSISSSLDSMEQDVAAEYRGVGSVQQGFMRRLGVNNVKVLKRDDVAVSREGDYYYIDVNYEVTIPFIGNVSLLLNFEHSASVRASL